jgi:hypothetical protein
MKKYVINFISGPSVGKSVMSAMTFVELKVLKFRTEYIQEYAKSLVWLKKFDLLNNQYYVSTEQYNIISSLYSVPELDFLVLDGSLLLGLYYNETYPDNVSNIDKTRKMILEKNSEFNHIYIYLERDPNIPFEVEGRVHSEAESLQIDKDLHNLLVEHKVPFKSFLAHKACLANIIKYILEFGKINNK